MGCKLLTKDGRCSIAGLCICGGLAAITCPAYVSDCDRCKNLDFSKVYTLEDGLTLCGACAAKHFGLKKLLEVE